MAESTRVHELSEDKADRQEDEHRRDAPEVRIGAKISQWLNTPDPWQLAKWLEGLHQPQELAYEDPYASIVRGLDANGMLTTKSGAFCDQVAFLLNYRPDKNPVGLNPAKFQYNLYMLSAALSCPKCLAEPLKAIYMDDDLVPGEETGAWRRTKLLSALRWALAENQIDESLQLLWLSMIIGKEPPAIKIDGKRKQLASLPGNALTGFAGLLNMVRMTAGEGGVVRNPEPVRSALAILLNGPANEIIENREGYQRVYSAFVKDVSGSTGATRFSDRRAEKLAEKLFRVEKSELDRIPASDRMIWRLPVSVEAWRAIVEHTCRIFGLHSIAPV